MLKYIWFGLLICLSSSLIAGPSSPIYLGIDELEKRNFAPLQGKKVGLLTHAAGVNRYGESTIDVLHRQQTFKLTALFSPEHGIRSTALADQKVANSQDAQTKLPIYSLYGKTRRPSAEALKTIDILVIDLQDIGTRSYTYVSCMCYALEACIQHHIPVIILDRPNPLGGLVVDGPMRDEAWKSYVGYLPIPYVHGLTIGEIAQMALQEGWLNLTLLEKKSAQLTVIPMRGWQADKTWDHTGLKWIPTSPNIPTLDAVFGYPMTGLGCQIGKFKHGIGTPYPFRFLSYPGKTPEQIIEALERFCIPGLSYRVCTTKAKNGNQIGVYIHIHQADHITDLNFYLMKLAAEWESPHNPFALASTQQAELFNKHTGSTALWRALVAKGMNIQLKPFFTAWQKDIDLFKQKSYPYHLYSRH